MFDGGGQRAPRARFYRSPDSSCFSVVSRSTSRALEHQRFDEPFVYPVVGVRLRRIEVPEIEFVQFFLAHQSFDEIVKILILPRFPHGRREVNVHVVPGQVRVLILCGADSHLIDSVFFEESRAIDSSRKSAKAFAAPAVTDDVTNRQVSNERRLVLLDSVHFKQLLLLGAVREMGRSATWEECSGAS